LPDKGRKGNRMKLTLRNALIALGNPLKSLDYTFAYLSYRKKIARLTGSSMSTIEQLYSEIIDSKFMQDMESRSGSSKEFSHLSMLTPFRAPTLYVMCRIFKPEIVVETGVANGYSSSFILYALETNRKGRLYSIDLPNQPGQEIEKDTGWLISENIRGRWELSLGASRKNLPLLLEKLRSIDLFYHDSDHSYENMKFEFELAWQYLAKASLLIADDITDNSFFDEFTAEKSFKSTKLFKQGIIIKEG